MFPVMKIETMNLLPVLENNGNNMHKMKVNKWLELYKLHKKRAGILWRMSIYKRRRVLYHKCMKTISIPRFLRTIDQPGSKAIPGGGKSLEDFERREQHAVICLQQAANRGFEFF